MKIILAIIVYILTIVFANYNVYMFGPSVTPINAFFLIGLDLSLRDWFQIKIGRFSMFSLIVFSGIISYLLNPATGIIAVASFIAFSLAAIADWLVFISVKGNWLKRSNYSNIAGSAVDSIAFPTIAFGSLMPEIILMQFVAKSVGGWLWSVIIYRLMIKGTMQKGEVC